MIKCPVCEGRVRLEKSVPYRYNQAFDGEEHLGLETIKPHYCGHCQAELYFAFANHPDYPRLVTAKQYNSASEIAGNDWIGSTCGEYTKRTSRGVTPPKGA